MPLKYTDDNLYTGTLYMGTPASQPIRLLFDTGSEYLITTSVFCDDSKAGKYKFKKVDPVTGNIVRVNNRKPRCPTAAYDM